MLSFLKSPFFKRGLPLMGIILGSAAVLRELQRIKYDIRKLEKGMSLEEANAVLKKNNITQEDLEKEQHPVIQSELKKMEAAAKDSWTNIRMPRPWENSRKLQEKLTSGSSDNAISADPLTQGKLQLSEDSWKNVMKKYNDWDDDSLRILNNLEKFDFKSGPVEERFQQASHFYKILSKQVHQGNKLSRALFKLSNATELQNFHDETKAANKDLSKVNTRLRTGITEMGLVTSVLQSKRGRLNKDGNK